MFWFQLVVVLLLLAAVGWLAVGGGGHMSEPVPDRADLALPGDRMVAARDLDQVRFSVGLRGYRMEEVDDVLDRLAREVEVRDRRIAELEGRSGEDAGLVAPSVDAALAGDGYGDSSYDPGAAGSDADADADAGEVEPAEAPGAQAHTVLATTAESGSEDVARGADEAGDEPAATAGSADGSGPDLPPLPRD